MQNFKQFLKENEYIEITDKDLVNGKLTKQYPDIKGDFDCSDIHLISLEFAPQSVEGYFDCSRTNITSLEFAPKFVGGFFNCSSTKITSLKGIGKNYLKEVKDYIGFLSCRELKSNMLGLLLVKGLQEIEFNIKEEIEKIFNRHLTGERDILDCQEELITKGFKEYAKL